MENKYTRNSNKATRYLVQYHEDQSTSYDLVFSSPLFSIPEFDDGLLVSTKNTANIGFI